jgi:hypothetical protein
MTNNFSDLIERMAWIMEAEDSKKPKNTASDLLKKQASIKSLFPTFDDRVAQVKSKGGNKKGVRMVGKEPNVWSFKVASGTYDDKNKEKMKADGHPKEYDVTLRWDNLEELIKKNAKDKRIWNKHGDAVDINKLTDLVMSDTDLQINCSCPADLYWGGQYIRTQRDAKYTKPENRPPVKRNPHQYGVGCKHIQVVFDTLPFYRSTMANFIKEKYAKLIDQIEGEADQEAEKIKKIAADLKVKDQARKDALLKKEKEQDAPKKVPSDKKAPITPPKGGKEAPKKEPVKGKPEPKKEEPKDQQRFKRKSV